MAFAPDYQGTDDPARRNYRVLTGSEDYTAILWDALTGHEILTLKGHTQEVTSVAFSPSDPYALTGSRDGTAIIWLARSWNETPTADAKAEPAVAE